MKRTTLGALCAFAAALAIAAGGATSAYGFSTAGSHKASLRPASQVHWLKSDDSKKFVCTSDGVPMPNTGTAPNQTCVIGGSTGTCIEKTDEPTAVQTCMFTQTTGDNDKHATATQIAATDTGPSTQKHTQIVNVQQTSVAASNYVDVSQVVKQSLGPGHFDDTDESEPDSATTSSALPIVTQQDLHQIVTVNQVSGTGDNDSSITQFGKQRARAKQAPSISEHQNTLPATGDEQCPATDDVEANICSVVNQSSTSGQNISTLDDTLSQFARAHKTMTGDQQQGLSFGAGGINHEIHQSSSGFCKIDTKQRESQVLRAVQANVTQLQHGPVRKGSGSNQNCSASSVWTGTQGATQLATSRPKEEDIGSLVYSGGANQDNTMEYFGFSSGDIRATQSVTERTNNQSETQTNSCPPPDGPSSGPNQVCAAAIVCENPDTDFGPAQAAPQDPGRCESFTETD